MLQLLACAVTAASAQLKVRTCLLELSLDLTPALQLAGCDLTQAFDILSLVFLISEWGQPWIH